MNLLFKIIYAAHANGTHHKLALDALRHLQCERADQWRAVFLKHAEQYLIGSKLPDKEFKDFAIKDQGVSSTYYDKIVSSMYPVGLTPNIIEERQMNAVAMDVFSRLMISVWLRIARPKKLAM